MEAEGSSTLGKRKRVFNSPHHRQNILGQILRLGDRKPVRQELNLADLPEEDRENSSPLTCRVKGSPGLWNQRLRRSARLHALMWLPGQKR